MPKVYIKPQWTCLHYSWLYYANQYQYLNGLWSVLFEYVLLNQTEIRICSDMIKRHVEIKLLHRVTVNRFHHGHKNVEAEVEENVMLELICVGDLSICFGSNCFQILVYLLLCVYVHERACVSVCTCYCVLFLLMSIWWTLFQISFY